MSTLHTLDITLENNSILPIVFGECDKNLSYIEKKLHITLHYRGNSLRIQGEKSNVIKAKNTLEFLYKKVEKGDLINTSDIDTVLRFQGPENLISSSSKDNIIITSKKHIEARSPNQLKYIKNMNKSSLCFGVGPAGTGKTFLAVAYGASLLLKGEFDKLIITRPVVEAGENLGFLPGDLKEKIAPYLRPIYDALYECFPAEIINKKLENNDIEIAPLAYMRGRTLKNAFIILDEAQNTTTMQMKMFLTRLGENSRMIITGDITQIDLPKSQKSGLKDALTILKNVSSIKVSYFQSSDVIRHPLVAEIIDAYNTVKNHD